jgi:hypothetical protein
MRVPCPVCDVRQPVVKLNYCLEHHNSHRSSVSNNASGSGSGSGSNADELKSVVILSTRSALNVVYYEIETTFASGRRARILARFREFDELNKSIRSDYRAQHKHLLENLPEFPSKAVLPWTDQNSAAFIAERKAALEAFLQKLITIPFASENKNLLEFLTRTVLDQNEYDDVFNLGKQAKAAAAAEEKKSAASQSSGDAAGNETKSVGSTTSASSAPVFFNPGYSSGTHPAVKSSAAPSSGSKPKPAAPAPEPTPAAQPVAAPAASSSSPTSSSQYKAPPPKDPAPTSGISGFIGGLFGKKKPKNETAGVDSGAGDESL